MLIITLTYKKSLDKVNQHLQAHRAFLDQYYKAGIFIASGPMNPREGGVILAYSGKCEAESILKSDPFYSEDIADYNIIEFFPNKYSQAFEAINILLRENAD